MHSPYKCKTLRNCLQTFFQSTFTDRIFEKPNYKPLYSISIFLSMHLRKECCLKCSENSRTTKEEGQRHPQCEHKHPSLNCSTGLSCNIFNWNICSVYSILWRLVLVNNMWLWNSFLLGNFVILTSFNLKYEFG